ncbi:MAG: hypothetical protein KY445_00575 [Armatimonadetes bacterium]|nr:hypothetical protein [Armatimonadota bacterium]
MKTHQHLWSMTAIVSTLLVCNMAVQMVNAQQETAAPKVLVAQEFRLVNARNQTLVTMSIGLDGSPQIALFDGRSGFGVSTQKLLELKVDGSGQPNLQLNDGGGKPRLEMSLVNFKGDGSAPRIEIMDADNEARGVFGINANNNPDLSLYGDTGAKAVLKPESLRIVSGKGKEFGTAWLFGGRGPNLIVADESGKWVWTAPAKQAAKRRK